MNLNNESLSSTSRHLPEDFLTSNRSPLTSTSEETTLSRVTTSEREAPLLFRGGSDGIGHRVAQVPEHLSIDAQLRDVRIRASERYQASHFREQNNTSEMAGHVTPGSQDHTLREAIVTTAHESQRRLETEPSGSITLPIEGASRIPERTQLLTRVQEGPNVALQTQRTFLQQALREPTLRSLLVASFAAAEALPPSSREATLAVATLSHAVSLFYSLVMGSSLPEPEAFEELHRVNANIATRILPQMQTVEESVPQTESNQEELHSIHELFTMLEEQQTLIPDRAPQNNRVETIFEEPLLETRTSVPPRSAAVQPRRIRQLVSTTLASVRSEQNFSARELREAPPLELETTTHERLFRAQEASRFITELTHAGVEAGTHARENHLNNRTFFSNEENRDEIETLDSIALQAQRSFLRQSLMDPTLEAFLNRSIEAANALPPSSREATDAVDSLLDAVGSFYDLTMISFSSVEEPLPLLNNNIINTQQSRDAVTTTPSTPYDPTLSNIETLNSIRGVLDGTVAFIRDIVQSQANASMMPIITRSQLTQRFDISKEDRTRH